MAFLDNCDYPLILLQNSTSVRFLKETEWDLPVESEALSMNFPALYTKQLKSVSLSCTSDGSFPHG